MSAGQQDAHESADRIIETDVLVVGGGPAGVAAAIAAAREGASVVLAERYGFLGGMLAAGLVSPMMTFHSRKGQVVGGIGQEVVARLVEAAGSPGHVQDTIGFVASVTPFDPEKLKLVLQEMVEEAGIRLILHADAAHVAASATPEPRPAGITVERVVLRHRGRHGSDTLHVRSQTVVDATGHGDIAASAGFPTAMGRDADGLVQPATLMFRVANVDIEKVRQYIVSRPHDFVLARPDPGTDLRCARYLSVAGFFSIVKEAAAEERFRVPRDRVLFFEGTHPGEVIVNMSRVIGVDPLNVMDMTRAELEARRQVEEIHAFLREYIPGFAESYVVQTGIETAFRESRRVLGSYVLTADDVVRGARFQDAVAMGAFPIDIHDPDGNGLTTVPMEAEAGYEIPLRCLLPRGSANLVVAGRCISTTHEAYSSTRVTATCFATGHAAGVVAALAAQTGRRVAALDAEEVRTQLRRGGAIFES
ncbi:MAG: FAD-dependent oxidoreductase [Bacillota bacterium]|nr:FAD-dependent oxidoreductase [Bacillota bacterium]